MKILRYFWSIDDPVLTFFLFSLVIAVPVLIVFGWFLFAGLITTPSSQKGHSSSSSTYMYVPFTPVAPSEDE